MLPVAMAIQESAAPYYRRIVSPSAPIVLPAGEYNIADISAASTGC